MKSKKLIVYLIISSAMILWSLSFIWYKEVYKFFGPFTTIFFRLAISSLFLAFFTKIFKRLQKIRRQDYGMILLLAIFEPFFYFIGESLGMQYVSSTLGALIISTIPLFAPFVARYMFNEKLSGFNIIGIIISFSGVILIILNKEFQFTASPKGVLLMFLAVISAVGYSAIVFKASKKYNSFTLVTVQNSIGAVLFLPLFIFTEYNHFITVPLTYDSLKPLFLLAIFASSLPSLFFTFGIKNLGISKANMFVNIIPIFTAIFAFILLDEQIDLKKIAGIFLVVTGLFLSQANRIFPKK